MNAHYRTAESLGVEVLYEAAVTHLELEGDRIVRVDCTRESALRRIEPKAVIVASGGFHSKTEWLTRAWGPAAENFLIRGRPYHRGGLLADLPEQGVSQVGDPTRCHAVANDGRAPKFDGGIVTRLDCVPFSSVVNKHVERFYAEVEDVWPKRSTILGRLVAVQPDPVGYVIIDARLLELLLPSVFPALHRKRIFTDGDITPLANLCHSCHYTCQYTAPHEFALNLPKALAEVRRDSWGRFAFPALAARAFHANGTMIAAASVLGLALQFLAIRTFGSASVEGFNAALSHKAMVAVFAPAFVSPLASLAVGLRRYWRNVGGARMRWAYLVNAFGMVANMKDLAAGYGDGCDFEEEDRFSHARSYAHQLVMNGFLLCFAVTGVVTVMLYGFGMHAPDGLSSFRTPLGVPGGLMLAAWDGQMGFVFLLCFVAVSGRALYALRGAGAILLLLALHLGAVLKFPLLAPRTKMAHGFHSLAALVRDAQREHETGPCTANGAAA